MFDCDDNRAGCALHRYRVPVLAPASRTKGSSMSEFHEEVLTACEVVAVVTQFNAGDIEDFADLVANARAGSYGNRFHCSWPVDLNDAVQGVLSDVRKIMGVLQGK
jgi:hypothetical protein